MTRSRISKTKSAKAKKRNLLAHTAGKKTQVMWVSGMNRSSAFSPVHAWLFLSFFPVTDDLLSHGRGVGRVPGVRPQDASDTQHPSQGFREERKSPPRIPAAIDTISGRDSHPPSMGHVPVPSTKSGGEVMGCCLWPGLSDMLTSVKVVGS